MNNLINTLAVIGIEPLEQDNGGDFSHQVTTILSWIVGLLGIVAVVVIIMGGVSYMTSAGDAGKVKKAKDTILYGIIGLIVAALAFAIVNWVIGGLNG